MNSLQKNKGTIITVVIFVLAIFLYRTFHSTDETIVSAGASAEASGNEIIALDKSLDKVSLDLTLFNGALYKSLVDFSPNLSPQPVGRSHPFDSIGK